MKNNLKAIVENNIAQENAAILARQSEIDNPLTGDDRRQFLKKNSLRWNGINWFTYLIAWTIIHLLTLRTEKVRLTQLL